MKRFVFVRHVDDIWGADLIELKKLSQKKSSFRYILMLIDVFSKYGSSVPLKFKTGEEVVKALEIFSRKTNLRSFGQTKEKNSKIQLLKICLKRTTLRYIQLTMMKNVSWQKDRTVQEKLNFFAISLQTELRNIPTFYNL